MPDPEHIAFVCPRFAEGPTVGGAETLMKSLALQAAASGCRVTFLSTCARDHFTWKNELDPGVREVDGLRVMLFPVDEDRDIPAFLRAQKAISTGRGVSQDEQDTWLQNNVNSSELCRHLEQHGDVYDHIVAGPYLFGLIFAAAQIHPARTFLVPCLHDEPFAYLPAFRRLFENVRGCLFNSEPERDLAQRLYGLTGGGQHVVGMGLEPFEADPSAFAARRGIAAQYVIYSGRREPMKGTPLLIDYLRTFRERTQRDIKIVLTGSGQVDLPSELAPHVLDAGFLPEEEKREAMAGALAFCHPSVNESFGIVLMESWLARTPALVHAKSEVLRFQCRRSNGGLWFRSYPDFEEELVLLQDNPELRDRLGAAGRDYVTREYAWPVIRKKLLAALRG
jgi:glycosyltransferase involved in cell wall biosynthesis